MQSKTELDKRVSDNGLKWFTPNGAQDDFIKMVALDGVFIGIFSAANGVGKTALLSNILGACIFGSNENPYFDYPFFNNFPYVHRGRIASSSKNVEEIGAIQTEIKRWFPKGKYEAKRKGKQFDSEYIINDWVFDIMTYEQDASQFESATLGIMIFDEPPPTKILFACIARMRKGGVILIYMTPLDTGGEIIEDLTSKEEVKYEGEVIGRVGIKYAEIEENCKQHGIRGQLEHKHIENMLNFYDPEERDARAKGKPVHLIGRIYPDFTSESPYVVDDFVIPEEWARVCIVDPHNAIPYAFSWAAIDPVGQAWIYDEFPGEDLEKIRVTNLTIPEYAAMIRAKEGRDLIVLRLADPYFSNVRYANTGKTVKEEFADLGLDFEDGDTSGLDVGHQRVREYLKYQRAYPVSATNHPKFHVFKSCRNHWRSLSRYKRKISKTGEIKDKIVIDETYKHFCDNVRHLLMRADLHKLQNLSREELPTYKIVGDMKDIRFDVDDDDETTYGRYLKKTKGVVV